MPVRLNSSGGGSVTLDVPSTGSAFTMTLPAANGNLGINLGTAQNSTSGTSIDFTGIPAGVRRVTVMLNGVSTNGGSRYLLQLGAGSVTTSGYNSASGLIYNSFHPEMQNSTAGFLVNNNVAANLLYGTYVFTNFSGTTWVGSHAIAAMTSVLFSITGGGNVSLGGALDRVRITTVNGTDTFDAGSINIAWEF